MLNLKNNRAPSRCCFKLCALFNSHQCILTWVTVLKRPFWVKIDDFFNSMTLKFDRWPCKTKDCTSSIILQALCIKFRKRSIRIKIGDLEIWRMNSKNNRVPLLCCLKLCASFHSNPWTFTGVIVQKRPIWVKIVDFVSRVTFKFDGWPWKSIGHLL